MVVIEGPDGAGKSTLVTNLAEYYGFALGERGVKNRDLLYTVTRSDTYRALAHAVNPEEGPRIWDRLFFSEMVYAPVVGRKCEFSPRERDFVNDVLTAINCPVIVCLPPFPTVAANSHKAHQMKGVNENLRDIYDHYDTGEGRHPDAVALQWPPQTLWYDYTAKRAIGSLARGDHPYVGYNQICSVIDDYLNERKERTP